MMMYVCLLRGTHVWEKDTERGDPHGRPECPISRAQHMLHEPDASSPTRVLHHLSIYVWDTTAETECPTDPSTACCMSQRLLPRYGSIAASSLEEHGP